MDSCGGLTLKFLKFLTPNDIGLNELSLPSEFYMKYGDRLPPEFHLKLRTGYHLPVDFDKRRNILKGLSTLYRHFAMKGGEVLVFEYDGRYDLNVYILGSNYSEIDYPSILHHFQSGHPRRVKIRDGGWKFVIFVDPFEPIVDEIEPPTTFFNHCAGTLGHYLRFVLSNGKKFPAYYNRNTQKITGLRGMCNLLGIPDLNAFHMLLFTYDGEVMFHVAAFDANLVEIIFPGSPIFAPPSVGQPSNSVRVASTFEITIKPFHMLAYCYGVDIPAKFKDLWHMWGKTESISVYSGSSSWRLQIRHRNNWKRATIHDGWIQFRDDMQLQVGDVCIFECPDDSFNHFNVRVIKKGQ